MDRLALSILCRAHGIFLDAQEAQELVRDPDILRILVHIEFLARLQEDAMHLHARDGPRRPRGRRLTAGGGRYPLRNKEPKE